MKKVLLTAIVLAMAIMASAQTQQGFVKTIGRPDKPGQPLGGVTIRMKGEFNPVVSRADGAFALPMAGKQVGDAYSLLEVKKEGYELNEQEMIGRRYAFSDRVPLYVLMASKAQLQADKQRIEDKAYEVAARGYRQRLDELQRQRDELAITAEQYRKEAAELQEKFEKYEALIDGMAEHYAHTDYDALDEQERAINLAIEAGELDRADSILSTLFDPTDVLQRNREALARLDLQIDQAHAIINQANEDMTAVLKQQARDAEHLYQLYTIAIGRYNHAKALHYIEIRAELDTTNVEWQMNAGGYMQYMAAYKRSLMYYQRALHLLEAASEKDREKLYVCHSHIGTIYALMHEDTRALEKLQQTLHFCEQEMPDDHLKKAACYLNLGQFHQERGNLKMAMELYPKATEACKKSITANSDDPTFLLTPQMTETFWIICINWAEAARELGQYDFALSQLTFIQNLYQLDENSDNPLYANMLNNMGSIYEAEKDNQQALKCYQTSLKIYERIFGQQHPNVALLYNNLGELYRKDGKRTQALTYHTQALAIRKACYGERHPRVAQSLSNIGLVLQENQQNEQALQYFHEALGIEEHQEKKNLREIATVENNMGMSYFHLRDFEQANEWFVRALQHAEHLPTPDPMLLTLMAGNLYVTNDSLGRTTDALSYQHSKLQYYALLIRMNEQFRTDFYRKDMALEYQDLALRYEAENDQSHADSCFQEAHHIFAQLPQADNNELADTFLKVGLQSMLEGKNDEAIDYLKKALNINLATHGELSQEVAQCHYYLSSLYLQKDMEKTGQHADKAVSIMEKLHPEGHPDLVNYYQIQGTCRLSLMNQDVTQNLAQTKRLNDFGAEDIYTRQLAIIEKFMGNQPDAIQTAVNVLLNIYIIKYATGLPGYKEKIQSLATKYPQYTKGIVDALQQHYPKEP